MTAARRGIATLGVVALIILNVSWLSAPLASARPAYDLQAGSPEQQLADKYAPIAGLRDQEEPCDRSGEGYFPAPIELVLGNPEITLKRHVEGSDTDTVVKEAPTAQDLVGLDVSYYLDFPGDPNEAGCTYETDFKRFVADSGAQPTTYAHVVTDHFRGKVVVQYWFWYYFNDWNNTHESDWEMVQLAFDAFSVEEALNEEPSEIGYAQHGSGEISGWDDDKLGRDGDRIVVYPAAGSHGTYYDQQLYIGWGENGTGFGCDNTSEPSTLVPLDVVLLPDDPQPDGEFAWLLYDGRWGELKSWEYNGPQGPNAGTKWNQPMASMETWRDFSVSVPASRAIGPNATDLFCGLTSGGSKLLTQLWNSPAALLTVALSLVGSIGVLFFFKRQELAEAFRLYRGHLRTFVGIGAATLPIGIIFNGFAVLLQGIPPFDSILKWLNDTSGARLTLAASIGGVQQAAMILLVAPPIIVAIRDIQAGRSPDVIESFRRSYRHLIVLIVGLLVVSISIFLLVLLVVGIPVAIWLAVRWQFFGQATLLDDIESGPNAVRRSGAVVTGHWWQALGDSLAFQLFSLIPGPLVGVVLLLFGGRAVDFANAFSSVVYAITVPITVIGLTLAYERYRGRAVTRARRDLADAPVEPTPIPG
jgi:hypothetical protein